MIQMYDVNKSYEKDTSALKGINLHIKKGEFVFLIGSSGAGKTTLLRLIFRDILPTKGQILINGRNIIRIKRSYIPHLRRRIGVVFQDFKLLYNRSVYENVSFALKVLGTPEKEVQRRTLQALDVVGLVQKRHLNPRKLAGGEQQRVAIARAIVNNPVILLADEPTGNLDLKISIDILNVFHSFHVTGTTVLFATHDISLVKMMDKRVIHLENGRIASDGKLKTEEY